MFIMRTRDMMWYNWYVYYVCVMLYACVCVCVCVMFIVLYAYRDYVYDILCTRVLCHDARQHPFFDISYFDMGCLS